MKNVKLNYLVVGSFTIAVIATLVLAVALLTGRTRATDSYHAYYDNVGGVQFGTRVLFEGYPIGQVEEIVPAQRGDKGRFRVELSVLEGWVVPADSTAEISAPGLLAAAVVNIRAGASSQPLTPGTEIKSRESTNMMAAVGELARTVQDMTETDIKPMLARLNAIVGGISELVGGPDQAVAADVRAMIENITRTTPEIVGNINTFSGRLESLLSDKNYQTLEAIIRDMGASASNMAEVTSQLDATRQALDGMMAEIRTMVLDNKLDVERSVVDIRHTAESVARYIDAINQNLDLASRNMAEFSHSIRQNPGLLLGGKPPVDNARTGGGNP